MDKYKLIALLIIIIYAISLAFTVYSKRIENEQDTNKDIKDTIEKGEIIVEFYYSSGYCGSCEKIKPIVNELEDFYSDEENLTIIRYPIDDTTYKDNLEKWMDYGFQTFPSIVVKNTTKCNLDDCSKNTTLLDTDEIYNFLLLNYTNLNQTIYTHLTGNYSEKNLEPKSSTIIDTPIGKIDYSDLSLPLITIVLGAADSVNPCSFFIILFLLSLLLHTDSRKKMMIVGSIFIFFSAFIYFILMYIIFNTAIRIDQQIIITIIAGLIATIFGILNIKDFFTYKKGPTTSISKEQKSKLYKQMRKIIKLTSIPSIIIATIILAISANMVELLCSLSLPLVYAGTILPAFGLDTIQSNFYLVFYNIIYVI
jgi:thiol-disulfide isomerase/thioredoxin